MHYYKKNIGDYAKKTGRLSMLQHGAYTLLIDSCYDRERFPTLEDAIEWTWASSTEELEAVKFVLTRFFTLEDGVYVQSRIKEEIAEYHSKAETNKRIAVEREAKRKEKSTTRARTVNESPKVGDEAPPNQEPRTTNQEPGQASKPRASRLAQDWVLPEDWAAWATTERPDLNIQDVADRFKDFWVAKAGKDGAKLDWQATWRNWVRNSKAVGSSAKRPSSHAGFAQVNYREGINDDGSFS